MYPDRAAHRRAGQLAYVRPSPSAGAPLPRELRGRATSGINLHMRLRTIWDVWKRR
jgi:hypothetical protein